MAAEHPPHESGRRAGDAGTIRSEDSRERHRGDDEHPHAEFSENHLKRSFFLPRACLGIFSRTQTDNRGECIFLIFTSFVIFVDNFEASYTNLFWNFLVFTWKLDNLGGRKPAWSDFTVLSVDFIFN